MTETAAIMTRDLVKFYGDFQALHGVDLKVQRGEIFGFLGPNGAGKTSTIRMVQAVAPPSSGSLQVLGLDPQREGKRIRQQLGVCPQEDNLDPDLTVQQNLVLYARYFGVRRTQAVRRADELLGFVALAEKRHRPHSRLGAVALLPALDGSRCVGSASLTASGKGSPGDLSPRSLSQSDRRP